MGVWKINSNDFSSIKRTPKELSMFWRTYFSKISIEFSKLYFRYFRMNVPIQLVSRDIVKARDFFGTLKHNSIIKPFQIIPHGELGFIHFPEDMGNFLINKMLGGENKHGNLVREITKTDLSLIEKLIKEKLEILQSQFLDDHRHLEIQLLDEEDILLYANSFHSEQLVSLQQFSIQFGDTVFVFTIGIANRMLEQFVQL